jgi:serine/threonine-protein kinase PRP4
LCDLGSASDITEQSIGDYLVSRFYRAPEIILGVHHDYAIDVWSIGCTLFELYTGKILFPGRTNNQMLRLMIECRGRFPTKLLRRGTYTSMHFNENLMFMSQEIDSVTGKDVVKQYNIQRPVTELKTRVMGSSGGGISDAEVALLNSFVDFLGRCLELNPEKRISPSEAFRHPFIKL